MTNPNEDATNCITNKERFKGDNVSPDGFYALSCADNGLVYIVFAFEELSVVSFFLCNPQMHRPGRAHFSDDMRQIILSDWNGNKAILSTYPGKGFSWCRIPVADAGWQYNVTEKPSQDIVTFICKTKSAYIKYVDSERWPFSASQQAGNISLHKQFDINKNDYVCIPGPEFTLMEDIFSLQGLSEELGRLSEAELAIFGKIIKRNVSRLPNYPQRVI